MTEVRNFDGDYKDFIELIKPALVDGKLRDLIVDGCTVRNRPPEAAEYMEFRAKERISDLIEIGETGKFCGFEYENVKITNNHFMDE